MARAKRNEGHRSNWISTGGAYPEGLPRLAFPLEGVMPEVYVPQSTILRMANGSQTHAYLWCFIEREQFGRRFLFNPSSLSSRRIKDLPGAIERLSERFRFDNTKPLTVVHELGRGMSAFLGWLDIPNHNGRFEAVLSDPDLALGALKMHHSYLRQRMQSNHAGKQVGAASASMGDAIAIKLMSVVHNREYANEIEAIRCIHGKGVKPPKPNDVSAFMACSQGVFDSVVRIVLDGTQHNGDNVSLGELCWQSGSQQISTTIRPGTHIERVMELGCVAFAALCVGDSGANLATIQAYEEPEDMERQLSSPEKLNLRHKIIKFRAGGKEVPVHLTSTTVTRLRSYIRLRESLRLRLDCADINPLFIQCKYSKSPRTKPVGIYPLGGAFTSELRRRFSAVGIKLPKMTMQQLRAYKGGRVAKEHNVKVAADMMGHSVSTAIRRYSKITEAESRSELAPYLSSLISVVLSRAEEGSVPSKGVNPITVIPAGRCADHGHPQALADSPLVEPDCRKTEGCFFCSNYHVHADKEDSIKLMSCRSVLERLAPRLDGSGSAERVYTVVIDRIDALLNEIKRINPQAHEVARVAVHKHGQLSRYWASKLQQLHLLGLITAPSS